MTGLSRLQPYMCCNVGIVIALRRECFGSFSGK
jgi:hypothetical protein